MTTTRRVSFLTLFLLFAGLALFSKAQQTEAETTSAAYTAMSPVLTDAGAKFLLEEAIAAVDQYPQAIVVVDAGGNIKAQTRMDGVAPGVMSAAASKARTSATFGMDAENLAGIDGSSGFHSVVAPGNMLLLAGGIPLMRDGAILGAIGCGGAPDPVEDKRVCQAAVDALMAALS